MAYIKYVKTKCQNKIDKSKTVEKVHVWICENTGWRDKESGKYKQKVHYAEKLGILGKTVGKAQARVALGRYMQRKHPLTADMTFRELIEIFTVYYEGQIGKTIRPLTFKKFQGAMIYFDDISFLRIRKVSFSDIEDFKNDLSKRVSASTVNISLNQISKLLKYALRKGYISEIPEIIKMRETPSPINAISSDELMSLLEVSKENENLHFYIYFMAFTGVRPHEFMNLHWQDVNMDERYIDIISHNRLKKGRRIPVHDNLIRELKKRPKKIGRVCPYETRFGPRRMVSKYGKKIGLRVCPGSLRKTFGSIMAENDTPIVKLAEIMGNSVAVCQKYYLKLRHETMASELNNHPLSL